MLWAQRFPKISNLPTLEATLCPFVVSALHQRIFELNLKTDENTKRDKTCSRAGVNRQA